MNQNCELVGIEKSEVRGFFERTLVEKRRSE